MLRIGVLGAGYLGSIHLKLLKESSQYHLVGFYDPNVSKEKKIYQQYDCIQFTEIDKLIAAVDVVDIVTPTLSHYDMAVLALEKKRHIFIEKPIANSIEKAESIILLAEKNNCLGQVGHIERFNPSFIAVQKNIQNPMFIECHRLAEFNSRGTDVSVVLDLMIHDIDIILSIVPSDIASISASGVKVISKTPDIANARIVFKNNCVANLTASRISLKKMRKIRLFQKDAYISIDLLEKTGEIIKMKPISEKTKEDAMILQNAEGEKKEIYFEIPNINKKNALLNELESFASAIQNKTTPLVSLKDGVKALKVADKIIRCF